MKTKKVLLGSLVLASVFTACTDENIVEGVQNNMPLTERTQVNLTLSASEIDSRMSNGSGWSSAFETHDVLGAVLVDKGFIADPPSSWTAIQWNNVDWTVVDGHVGNNKWFYDADKKKFITEGTTAVGSWLFYTKYNEKMTTTRNGVEFDFPQIQEGSTDLEWVMNNNANFMISPVAHIDGYEGQNLDFSIRMASVFNYLRMPFDLKATGATQVQKIVVKAKSGADTDVEFPTEYKVVNTALPEAYLSLDAPSGKTVKCPNVNPTNVYDVTDQNAEMDKAYNKLVYATTAKDSYYDETGTGDAAVTTVHWDAMVSDFESVIATRNAEKNVKYLVVDLDGEHADKSGKGGLKVAADGKFSAVMLMPAGVYYSITFDIYTDKGVFTKTVTDRHAWAANLTDEAKAALPQATKNAITASKNMIFLRPGRVAVLSDIEGAVAGSNYAETLDANEYIKVKATEKLTTEDQYITKTADLINFINGITATKTECEVNVISQEAIGGGVNDDATIPEHSIIVNQEVMDAIVKKENALGKDIQLIFKGATIKVKGNAEAGKQLNIHDMTFNDGAEVISGYVKATESVNVPTSQKMLVKSGVNLELALVQGVNDEFNSLEVESGATVKATTNAAVDNLLNKGTFSIAANKTITSETVENKGAATVNGAWTINAELKNVKSATLTNNGDLTLANDGTGSSNNGTINNNKNIFVYSNLSNAKSISNAKGAVIEVDKNASLNNAIGAIITNEGRMTCVSGTGENKINNLGIIYAKKESRTYITTNSSDNETTNGTNSLNMGTIVLDERNADVSVTVGTQQGYIQYAVPASVSELKYVAEDKYNKVLLYGNTILNENENERVKYIVVESAMRLTLPATATIQEIDFNANTVLGVMPDETQMARLALINIAKGVEVTVPTENAINVEDVTNTTTVSSKTFTSKTIADINNKGEMIVGGDLYSSLPESITYNNGKFSSGDGENTAYHWTENPTVTTQGYLNAGGVAKVLSNDGFVNAIKDATVEVVKLPAGTFKAEVYSQGNVSGRTLKIEGADGTKVGFSNYQVNIALFDEFTIENCEILKKEGGNNWGMMLFGGSNNANGKYTIKNCTFNGVGTQGVFINETASGATYNIENCTFNGDFGTEGAITIQNNNNVQHTVNVIGCSFNNIPATSHKIFVHYAYDGWTLNTDLNDADIYWKAK